MDQSQDRCRYGRGSWPVGLHRVQHASYASSGGYIRNDGNHKCIFRRQPQIPEIKMLNIRLQRQLHRHRRLHPKQWHVLLDVLQMAENIAPRAVVTDRPWIHDIYDVETADTRMSSQWVQIAQDVSPENREDILHISKTNADGRLPDEELEMGP